MSPYSDYYLLLRHYYARLCSDLEARTLQSHRCQIICDFIVKKVKSNPFHNASPGPSMAEMARSSQTQQMGLQQVLSSQL